MKGWPRNPIRSCRNRIDPGDERRMPNAMNAMMGTSTGATNNRQAISKVRFHNGKALVPWAAETACAVLPRPCALRCVPIIFRDSQPRPSRESFDFTPARLSGAKSCNWSSSCPSIQRSCVRHDSPYGSSPYPQQSWGLLTTSRPHASQSGAKPRHGSRSKL
jgi:hypothetical protein